MRLANINIDNLYLSAKRHMLTSMIGQILKSVNLSSPEFNKSIASEERKIIILDDEYRKIVSEFESSDVWYMPLKGMVLKDYYPGFAMREMADVDILFDPSRAEDVKKIMESLGYKVKSFGDKNDDDYIKPPVSNFELHRYLFYKNAEKHFYEYYKDVKDQLLVKDEDNHYGYHFNAEDFYIFMIAHEYKHYYSGGTGLRSLLDTAFFLKNNRLDMDYVSTEINKLGIEEYESRNRSLAVNLLNGNDLTETEQSMLEYIISSGTFGTYDRAVDSNIKKAGGRYKYIIRRIIGPIRKSDPFSSQFRNSYSFFFKYPVLFPFLPFYRLILAITKRPKRLKNEIKAINKSADAKK